MVLGLGSAHSDRTHRRGSAPADTHPAPAGTHLGRVRDRVRVRVRGRVRGRVGVIEGREVDLVRVRSRSRGRVRGRGRGLGEG